MPKTLRYTKEKLKEEKEKLQDLEYLSKYLSHNEDPDLKNKKTSQEKIIEDLEKELPQRFEGFFVKGKSSGKHRKRKITKKRKHKKSKTKKRKTKNKRNTKKR